MYFARFLTVAVIVQVSAAAASTQTVSVSTNGSDSVKLNLTVDRQGPFASIERAISVAEEIAEKLPVDSIRVEIGPGTYRIRNVIKLDGARLKGVSISIVGSEDVAPRITGMMITDNKGPNWSITLPSSLIHSYYNYAYGMSKPIIPHPLLVWKGDTRIIPGRWPLMGWAFIHSAAQQKDGSWYLSMKTENGIEPNLSGGEVRVAGFFGEDWAFESVPASVVNATTIKISTGRLTYPPRVGRRIYLEGIASSTEAKVTVSAKSNTLTGSEKGLYEIPMCEGFIRINGAAHVSLKNMHFDGYTGDVFVVADSKDISINNNIIERAGGRAILVARSLNVQAADNIIRHLGEGGVDVGGGDRFSLTSSDIVVSRNDISNFSELSLTYRPGVRINGVGVKVLNNHIHNAPHTAIIFGGNNHLMQGNDIYDVVKEVRDSGAIYAGRDWTTYGTVIKDNLLYNIKSTKLLKPNGYADDTNAVRGIYLDDFVSGIYILGNIFINVDYAIFVNGGSDIISKKNVFINSHPPFALLAWGKYMKRSMFGEDHAAVQILRSVQNSGSPLLRENLRLSESVDELLVPKGNQFVENALINSPSAMPLRGADKYMDWSNSGGVSINLENLPALKQNGLEVRRQIRDILYTKTGRQFKP